MTRAKQANESSETDPKESKHGKDLYQNAGGGDRSYAIDFKGGRNFGEAQAEVEYYVSDVGRTAPVSGRFTAEQKKLYDVYLPCFLKSARSVRPGVTQHDLEKIFASCAREQLPTMKESYLRNATEDFIREVESHSTLGHYQDLNVMGAGAGNDEPLEPGMVFAIEPVLYSKELNFAVFLEDVILVTANGYDVLSKGMPYTTEEIEKLMAQMSIIEASKWRIEEW